MALYISSKWMNLYCPTPMDKPIGKPMALPMEFLLIKVNLFSYHFVSLPATSGNRYLGLSLAKIIVAHLLLRAIKV